MIANQNFDDSTDESEYGYSRPILHLPETSKKHGLLVRTHSSSVLMKAKIPKKNKTGIVKLKEHLSVLTNVFSPYLFESVNLWHINILFRNLQPVT